MINQPFANHKGGQLVFGADGFLYIGLGDGGMTPAILSTTDRTCSRCWEKCFASGWILLLPEACSTRFRRTILSWAAAERPRSMPTDCAIPGASRWSAAGSRIFVADVGQASLEEVDILQKGGNYGWRVMEGDALLQPAHGLRHQRQSPADCRISTTRLASPSSADTFTKALPSPAWRTSTSSAISPAGCSA